MKQSLLKLVLLLVIGIAGGSKAMADDVTFYRLVPAPMSGTSQTATIDGITWAGSVDFYDGKWTFYPYPNSTGTQQISSKTAMQQDVTKIVVHHTVDEYITVNSLKLVVNNRSDFADVGKVEEQTISEYNEVMTFTPSLGKSVLKYIKH